VTRILPRLTDLRLSVLGIEFGLDDNDKQAIRDMRQIVIGKGPIRKCDLFIDTTCVRPSEARALYKVLRKKGLGA
jgi:hypothetical protein